MVWKGVKNGRTIFWKKRNENCDGAKVQTWVKRLVEHHRAQRWCQLCSQPIRNASTYGAKWAWYKITAENKIPWKLWTGNRYWKDIQTEQHLRNRIWWKKIASSTNERSDMKPTYCCYTMGDDIMVEEKWKKISGRQFRITCHLKMYKQHIYLEIWSQLNGWILFIVKEQG